VFLLSLYVVPPDWILLVPFGLWALGVTIWFASDRAWLSLAIAALLGAGALWVADTHTRIEVNQFKGVSYARKFPDSKRIWVDYGPFGYLEAYTSSYLHFAPGLSDNAAVNLEAMPKNAYIAMYIDSDGPIGVLKKIPKRLTAYFEFLPMYMPYVLKKHPDVFIVQLGGGISTDVALVAGAKSVTVAEDNPEIRRALTRAKPITRLTGNPLEDKRVTLVPYAGRLYVAGQKNRYDVIDLSLADSTGLSRAGGFAIVEKYNYTTQTLRDYMTALKPDGILAVTLWNKEDLPKSIPKFFATAVKAAWQQNDGKVKDKFFILHTYLSTMTLLYKKDGFTADEVEKLKAWSDDMSYEVLYYPGATFDMSQGPAIFRGYRASYFDIPGFKNGKPVAPDQAAPKASAKPAHADDPTPAPKAPPRPLLTWGNLYKLILAHLMNGQFDYVQQHYVFDTRPLTNNRPYFAGYIKPLEIPNFLDQLDAVSSQWGYLLLWATLIIAGIFGFMLMMIPVIWGWRTIFSRQPGKIGIFIYFFALGLGYIVVEVGLIGKFLVALANPTISASVLITSMLFFSGLGSLTSGRYIERCRKVMPRIFVAIAALLALGAFVFDPILGVIGEWPYVLRVATCILLVAPVAFLMGFPFPTGMGMLSKLGKERFFLWAWGINGTFSVVGAVAVPIVNVIFGQQVLILAAAAAYLLALPAFFSLLKPAPGRAPAGVAAPA
jgi:spermidine synthase